MDYQRHQGWVKIYRNLLASPIFLNPDLLQLYLYCVLRANHKENWVTVKTGRSTTEVKVNHGQFIFGRNSTAKTLRQTPSGTWKRMQKLKKGGILNIESNSHYSVVTLVNWEFEQLSNEDGDSKGNNQVTGKEQRGDTDKNAKNEKNEKKNSLSDFDLEILIQDISKNLQLRLTDEERKKILFIYKQKSHHEAIENPSMLLIAIAKNYRKQHPRQPRPPGSTIYNPEEDE